jgi:copper transport protein
LRRFAAQALAAAAVVLLGLSAAPLANAHAVLVSSTPVDGTRLDTAPAEVTLTFDEAIELVPATAQVIAEDGTRVDTAAAHVSADGATVVIPLRANLPAGSYAAMWRVISADTHVVSGSISFGIRQDAHAPPAQAVDHARGLTIATEIAQGLVYLGLVLCLGVTFACAILWNWALKLARIRALIWSGWALTGCATVAQFLFEGPRALGMGWAKVTAGAALYATLHSRTGELLIVRAAVLLLVAVTVRSIIRRATTEPGHLARRRLTIFIASAVALAVTVAALGHAGAGDDSWLATPVTAAHLLAMAVWVGGLITLGVAVLPTRGAPNTTNADNANNANNLRAWSLTAFGCVCVLILTGEYQAWRQVSPVEAMWSTRYGLTLTIKLALVVTMFALAIIARRRSTAERLRRTAPAEAALGVAVVVITTVLVSQPSARSTYGPPVTLSAPLDTRSAAIHITTTRHGPTSIAVTTLDNHDRPVHASSVKGTLSSQDAHIAAWEVPFAPAPDEVWQSANAVVPRAGWWTLTLTVEFSTSQAIVTAAHFRAW